MGGEAGVVPAGRLKWYIDGLMLSLNLAKVRASEEHFEETYSPAELLGDGDGFRIATPVSLVFDLFKDKRKFRLVGHVRGSLELPCSRCAEPFVYPVEASFDLRYQPREPNTGESEREVEEEDLSTAFYEDDTIDLALVVREQFYLSLPMKPLCEETCLGLCSQCGANLNRADCHCQREWTDPRLAGLSALQMSDHRKN
jgi:uncharacterized protein